MPPWSPAVSDNCVVSQRYGRAEAITSLSPRGEEVTWLPTGVGNLSQCLHHPTCPDERPCKPKNPENSPNLPCPIQMFSFWVAQSPKQLNSWALYKPLPSPTFLQCFLPKLGSKKSPSTNSSANTEHMSRRTSDPSGNKCPIFGQVTAVKHRSRQMDLSQVGSKERTPLTRDPKPRAKDGNQFWRIPHTGSRDPPFSA